MTKDDEIEQRLRAMMNNQADRVDPGRVGNRISVATLMHTDSPHERRTSRFAAPFLAAACVAAAGIGVSIVAHAGGGHQTAQPSHMQAAASSEPYRGSLGDNQVTYVRIEGSGTGTDGPIEVWIPADRASVWQLTQPNLLGGLPQRASCAAFPEFRSGLRASVVNRQLRISDPGQVPGCGQGSWSYYRPEFFDSLPADAPSVLASMRSASSTNSDAAVFETGFDALSDGMVQPAAVDKIVAALKLLPGTTVSQDGRTIGYAGRIKATVLEHWSFTLDGPSDRVVGTTFSYDDTAPLKTTLTYRTVSSLGAR